MNILRKIYCRCFQQAFHVAIPFMPYREPKLMKQVEDIVPLLKEKDIERVLLVTDQGIRGLGLTGRLETALHENDIACVVYDRTIPNPTIVNVEEARELYIEEACQAIIAFGGGSSMDCAKACGARIVKPEKSVQKMKGLLKICKKLPLFIAVPTTAGTGSETTLAAVITDGEKHHKYPINDFSLIPHYAVLDYRVTLGLPKSITATTGMDALTHAVEAYIGNSTTILTRKNAVEAVSLIHRYLKRAYDDGGDKKARTGMLKAAFFAGVAFTQSYVGYVHAIAHSLGGKYGTPHGLANAVILPIMLREYGAACERKLAKLARKSGVIEKGLSNTETAEKFIDWIQEMNDSMGIPRNIPEINPDDVPKMSGHADKEGNPLYPVPVLMNRKELAKMYEKIRTNM